MNATPTGPPMTDPTLANFPQPTEGDYARAIIKLNREVAALTAKLAAAKVELERLMRADKLRDALATYRATHDGPHTPGTRTLQGSRPHG